MDSTGSNLPSGYLVLCNTSGTFSDPADTVAQGDDANCADGTGVMNVMYGGFVAWCAWAGLNAATQYYFKVLPYSNSGAMIDYKIDTAPATGNATTSTGLVNSTDDVDDGACDATHCSLREAITYATLGDSISFSGTAPMNITLTSPLPDVTGLTIDGTGKKVSIDANGTGRVFNVTAASQSWVCVVATGSTGAI